MRGGDWTWYWVQSMFRFWLKQGGMVRGASTWSCEKTRHTGMRARSGRTQQRAPSTYLVPVEHQTLGGVIPVLVVLKKLAAWCRRDTRAHKWVWRGTQTHNHLWVRGHLGTAQRAAWSLRIAGPCPPSLRTSRCGRTNTQTASWVQMSWPASAVSLGFTAAGHLKQFLSRSSLLQINGLNYSLSDGLYLPSIILVQLVSLFFRRFSLININRRIIQAENWAKILWSPCTRAALKMRRKCRSGGNLKYFCRSADKNILRRCRYPE